MTLLYRVLSYLSRDVCGRPCHVKAKSRAIDKKAVQHISREKDVVYFNKQQCNTRDYVLNDFIYSTTEKYKDLHSIQRVNSVKILVSTARLEVIIGKKKA